MGRPTAQQIADRKAVWNRDVSRQLSRLLDQLLAAPDCAAKPPSTKGVYLLSERGVYMYVGRAGRQGFGKRRQQHLQGRVSGRSFKYWLTMEARYKARKRPLPRNFWARAVFRDTRPWKTYSGSASFQKELKTQVQRMREMTFRVVEIDDPKLAAMFEIYASTILGTMNSWETH